MRLHNPNRSPSKRRRSVCNFPHISRSRGKYNYTRSKNIRNPGKYRHNLRNGHRTRTIARIHRNGRRNRDRRLHRTSIFDSPHKNRSRNRCTPSRNRDRLPHMHHNARNQNRSFRSTRSSVRHTQSKCRRSLSISRNSHKIRLYNRRKFRNWNRAVYPGLLRIAYSKRRSNRRIRHNRRTVGDLHKKHWHTQNRRFRNRNKPTRN